MISLFLLYSSIGLNGMTPIPTNKSDNDVNHHISKDQAKARELLLNISTLMTTTNSEIDKILISHTYKTKSKIRDVTI